MLDYEIIVPSHKRPFNMPLLRSLLPTATICVDEREAAAYRGLVPASKLLLHPPLQGRPAVANWMSNATKRPILIQLDDDFVGVRSLIGSKRFITDPDEILQILENAAQLTQDLGLTAFTFCRVANHVMVDVKNRPFIAVSPVCAAFGLMGKARYRRFDTELDGRADTDFTMRTLLEDRAVFVDRRFYFDFGPTMFGNCTPDQYRKTTRELRARYGKWLKMSASKSATKTATARMSIAVPRRNNGALH